MKTNPSYPFIPWALCSFAIATSAADTQRLLPFQGRITGPQGSPPPDGPALIQFQAFESSSGGKPIWSGELHRVTVNQGLINVALGTKNEFPHTRTNEQGAVSSFFDSTLFLEVTLDTSGKPDGTNDGVITKADLPMMPRQALFPVPHAVESTLSHHSLDSQKLAGLDWGVLLVGGILDPSSPSARFRPSLLSSDVVDSERIKDGSIPLAKLAQRQIGLKVPLGGLAISEAFTWSTNAGANSVTGSPGLVDVPAVSVSLVTSGRPVFLSIVPGPPHSAINPNDIQNVLNSASGIGSAKNGHPDYTSGSTALIALVRNATNIVSIDSFFTGNPSIGTRGVITAAGALHAVDLDAGVGTNTYTIKVGLDDFRINVELRNVRLIAYEL